MGRFAILFACVMTVGCLRPVWDGPLVASSASSSRNGSAPVGETDAEDPDDTDRYRVSFGESWMRPERIVLIGTETSFVLGCSWQGTNCLTLLPEEARGSSYLRIHVDRRMCPRVRIFRDDEELALIERFRWSCVMVLEEPTESPP
ncbi:hypothetical protein M0Q28_00990 [Patescibacteria group bacterium]|jgi:hypothetical protein|nr:hypothetical protein [Patescibacteria group bacterium]